jgi:prepilin-type N-terminal cleavage/methylation domain-containing protein
MRSSRAGFTLFELILAVALSAILLTLIGTAINLYLMRIDTDRTRVEEAQLARSVLAMIADDIRATSIYQKQDTTQLAQLMLASTPFDVNDIDKPRAASPNSPTTPAALPAAAGGVAAAAATPATSGSSAGSSLASANGSSANASDSTIMPLGINSNGSNAEVYIDVTHLPGQEELFSTTTGYTNAESPVSQGGGGMSSSTSSTEGNVDPPADLKTIHYYVRPGNPVEPGSIEATSLSPATQASAGGLVREEVPRQTRLFTEQQGNSAAPNNGGTLIAPEVAQIQFRFFDGSQTVDEWDMLQTPQLPVAVEVSVWLRSARANSSSAENSSTDTLNGTREYKQVVFLPNAALSAAANAASTSSTSSTDSSTDSSSSSSNSNSGNGSAFEN